MCGARAGQARDVHALAPERTVPRAIALPGTSEVQDQCRLERPFRVYVARSPFVMTIRSLSEIPDEFNRPVIVKMTGLRGSRHRRPRPAKPGCIQGSRP